MGTLNASLSFVATGSSDVILPGYHSQHHTGDLFWRASISVSLEPLSCAFMVSLPLIHAENKYFLIEAFIHIQA